MPISHDAMTIRIGQGFDLHRTIQGRPLMLGGVDIPCDFGLDGHSDADVLLHAITDAFLGALALDDIGTWFPDTRDEYKNANSAVLLQRVLAHPAFKKWELCNLDCTITAERPKIGPHRQAIRESLASIIGCDISQISVKAKTNEGLGDIGEGRAISANAIVLVKEKAPASSSSILEI